MCKASQGYKNLLTMCLWIPTITLTSKKHMVERISTLFRPFVLDWNCIQFSNSISALQPFHPGNVMKVIKTWMNAWTTSSRMGGAHHIYACRFGCKDVTDRLGHYIECLMMFSLWKFMHRDLSIHATDRWGLSSPNKRDIMHICCVFFCLSCYLCTCQTEP